MDKKLIRKEIRKQLKDLPTAYYDEASLIIRERLLNLPSIINSTTIALTFSRQREVDTKQVIEALWALGKQVVLPKCNPQNHSMEFYKVTNFNQLETVYLDLMEPIPEKTVKIKKEYIDVIIVPGVVFDRGGYRIGYGGGYYDRYLNNFNGDTISLAFQMQIVDSLPKEEHDIPVQWIITEQEFIDCQLERSKLT